MEKEPPDIWDALLLWGKRLVMVLIVAFALFVLAYQLGYIPAARLMSEPFRQTLPFLLIAGIVMVLGITFNRLRLLAVSILLLGLAALHLLGLL